jgi:hypothetical protein
MDGRMEGLLSALREQLQSTTQLPGSLRILRCFFPILEASKQNAGQGPSEAKQGVDPAKLKDRSSCFSRVRS